ncbi:MAG: DoxX family protein [Gemmatimonadaceae bacterium]|nr:DoxX family protein [Chitinophagaceae bacterium]
MKKTKVLYWIFTGLFLFVMLGSAIPDILVMDMAVQGFKEMGLPVALVPFLGVAKALGVIAILVRGFPLVKEWAYAGLIFDLVGATYLVAAAGKPFSMWAPMLIFIGLGFASYYFYHKLKRELSLNKREEAIVRTDGFATV